MAFYNFGVSKFGADVIVDPTLIIDVGANTTTDLSLSLAIYKGTFVDAQTMRFSNDNSVWTAWEPYSTTKIWTIGDGYGVKTIYAQLKDSAGVVSETLSASITLIGTVNNLTGYVENGNLVLNFVGNNLSLTDLPGIEQYIGGVWTPLICSMNLINGNKTYGTWKTELSLETLPSAVVFFRPKLGNNTGTPVDFNLEVAFTVVNTSGVVNNSSIVLSGTRTIASNIIVESNDDITIEAVTYDTPVSWSCTVSALPLVVPVTINIQATNGYSTTAVTPLEVTFTPPVTLTINSPDHSFTSFVDLNGTANEITEYVSFSINGAYTKKTIVPVNGLWTVQLTGLILGTNTISIRGYSLAHKKETLYSKTITYGQAVASDIVEVQPYIMTYSGIKHMHPRIFANNKFVKIKVIAGV